jgi:hypothetical protein
MNKILLTFLLLILSGSLFAQPAYPYLFVSKFAQSEGVAITDTALIANLKAVLDTSTGIRRLAKPQLAMLMVESATQNRSLGYYCRSAGECSLLTNLTKFAAPGFIIERMLTVSQQINAGQTNCSLAFYILKNKADMIMFKKICQKAGCTIAVFSINPKTVEFGMGIVMPDSARKLYGGAFRRLLTPLRADMFGKYYTAMVRF